MPALAKLGFNGETGSPRFVPALAKPGFNGETGRPRFVPALAKLGFNGAATVSADSHLAFMRWASQKTVYIPSMAPRNHAACIGDYCDAILSGEIIAGRYVQLAVERHLDDLEHAHKRGLYLLQFERLNWRQCLRRRR